mgnify:CR=1 FL=1
MTTQREREEQYYLEQGYKHNKTLKVKFEYDDTEYVRKLDFAEMCHLNRDGKNSLVHRLRNTFQSELHVLHGYTNTYYWDVKFKGFELAES